MANSTPLPGLPQPIGGDERVIHLKAQRHKIPAFGWNCECGHFLAVDEPEFTEALEEGKAVRCPCPRCHVMGRITFSPIISVQGN